MILCEKDYYQRHGFKCHQCQGYINDDNHALFGDYKYHPQCLQCPGCTIMKTMMVEPDENEKRFDYNGRPYCLYHYSLIKGTECQGCGQAVLNKTQETAKWHQECHLIQKVD
jgi:hypothetical protein